MKVPVEGEDIMNPLAVRRNGDGVAIAVCSVFQFQDKVVFVERQAQFIFSCIKDIEPILAGGGFGFDPERIARSMAPPHRSSG
jgi:hypothetical protein